MNLTERAEKALLGALLTDPLTIRQTGLAEAGHFASPLHRQIHAALVPHEKNTYAGWAGSLSPNAAYARARGVTGDIYLQELLDACPDASHAPVYAQMVMEAALRRQLALYARRIKYEAANMHHELNRLQDESYRQSPSGRRHCCVRRWTRSIRRAAEGRRR
jgi:replicative DNA helicase